MVMFFLDTCSKVILQFGFENVSWKSVVLGIIIVKEIMIGGVQLYMTRLISECGTVSNPKAGAFVNKNSMGALS